MSEWLMFFLIILLLALLSFWVRFRALRINPGLGVDNWYWLLCIEDVKRYHRIPARLPYFMLEIEEQWYPPLYSFFMSLFPTEILKRHGGKIAQLMDLLNGFIIFLSVLWLIDNITIDFDLSGDDSVGITATAKSTGKTGVEMEALVATSVAALTIYDMAKSVDKGMTITDIYLESKKGGKSGTYQRKEA